MVLYVELALVEYITLRCFLLEVVDCARGSCNIVDCP